MRFPARFTIFLITGLSVVCTAPSGYAQDATTRGTRPGYVRKKPVNIQTVRPFNPGTVLVLPAKAGTPGSNSRASSNSARTNSPSTNAATTNGGSTGGNIVGLQTVPTFAGAFAAQNGPDAGNVFPFIMIGNDPLVGGTTTIPAKITEVSLQLLKADGSTFKTVPYAPFQDLVEDSPNFEEAKYDSSHSPTQFADAVQRAEFFHMMDEDWHTRLSEARIVNRVTITVPRFVDVQLSDGTIITVRAYFSGTAPDGSTFVLMLDLLFDFFFGNAVMNDINANNFTTDALNFDLFPNTYLFSLNLPDPSVPGNCCVLGFHTYFFDPTVIPQPRWITIFASFMSPGIFGAGFQDVTALSHETSEAFNDPFVDTTVPTWQFPNEPPTSKFCQNNLETGDPLEVLATATVPIRVRENNKTFIFHPQTEALLQWFEMGATSNAVDGAFSYPDRTALTQSAVPCPQ